MTNEELAVAKCKVLGEDIVAIISSARMEERDAARTRVELTREFAEVVVQMAEVCHSEGIGPDNAALLKAVFVAYPDLKAGTFLPEAKE